MRILFISNYSQLYGANRSLLSVIEYFKQNGDEVCLLLPSKGNLISLLEERDIPKIVIPFFSQIFYYKKNVKYIILPLLILCTLLVLPYIIYVIKKYDPDIIYSNTSAENIGIFISKILNKKHISHIREFMDVDHGAHFIFGNKLKRKLINLSDGIIYVSHAVANHVNLNIPLSKKQVVIYNGVDSHFDRLAQKSISKRINMGIVGILDKEKGQDLAIEYFKEVLKFFPYSKLHVWGDKSGRYKRYLHSLFDSFALKDYVIFHGFESNVNIIYKDMDILLMCSKSEGFGRVTVEAMQRGIPVIGYDGGGTSELIRNGYNGFLFKTQDEFVKAVRDLLASEAFYDKISKQSYEYGVSQFSTEKYCNSVRMFVYNIVMQ